MTGPYTIKISPRRGGESLVEFDAHEVSSWTAISATADRYRSLSLYAPGSGPLVVAERAGVVLAASLAVEGDEFSVGVFGYVGGKLVECRSNSVRRETDGSLYSSIGSRFNERLFRGL